MSAISNQIRMINEAFELQAASLQPQLDQDRICAQKIQELYEIVMRQKALAPEDSKRIYDCLSRNRANLAQSLERLKCESFVSHFFSRIFSKDLIVIVKEAQKQLFTKCTSYILDEWAAQAKAGENRAEARRRIDEFLHSLNVVRPRDFNIRSSLSLDGLGLTCLPDIFNNEGFEGLKILNLSHNRLTQIPESIRNLVQLTELSFGHNELTQIPESIGNLVQLKNLYFPNNLLTSIPESIGNLVQLEYLSLSCNGLTQIPESIGNLVQLTGLNLFNNCLIGIPESIGNLVQLRGVNLSLNRLTQIPESIGNLVQLIDLYFSDNRLTSIPESIGNLRCLKRLYLDNNQNLSGLPAGILQLSSQCVVEVTGCGLSMEVLGRLQQAMSVPGYAGPRISHAVSQPRDYQAEGRSVEESIADLCNIAERRVDFALDLSNIYNAREQEKSVVRIWLGRMSYMADYKSGGERQKKIAENVLDYLKRANDNEDFRGVFYGVIGQSIEACGDRQALCLMYLDLKYQIHKIDEQDIQRLAHLLIRGEFILGLLEDIARAKICTLRLVDETEVYLGYPVMLKERLQIPISVEEMLYFRCSNITERDLAQAENFVQMQLANHEIVCSFLIKQEKWKQALAVKFPEEMEILLQKKAKDSEKDESDYVAIENEYNAGLMNLTDRVLRSLS